jgi:hypothetical protein
MRETNNFLERGIIMEKTKIKRKKITALSFTGEFPNLCSGILRISLSDGLIYNFGTLTPGGTLNEDYEGVEGEWGIDGEQIPENFPAYLIPEVIKRINSGEIRKSCCGGCG